MKWHGPNQPLQVGDFNLAHPLTYFSGAKASEEPSAIGKQVVGKQESKEMLGYWPSYSMMSPGQRRVYLNWMATGRQTMPPEIGYAFVYFYGLERRVLKDKRDDLLVFAEVMRLRSVHLREAEKVSRSFLGYTGSLLWLLLADKPQQWDQRYVKPLVESQRWQSDRTPIALAWCAAHAVHLPSWLAVKMAAGASEQRNLAAKIAPDELAQLFHLRYHETWPDGLPVSPEPPEVMAKAQIEHFTASSILGSVSVTLDVPRKALRALEKLAPLWDSCTQDLRPFASLRTKSKRDGQEADNAAHWEALPSAIRAGNHPIQTQLSGLADTSIHQQNYAPLQIAQIANLLSLPKREKYTAEQSLRLARVAECCGYSIEPDSRMTGKAYRGDEWVVLFAQQAELPNREKYRAASLALRLGLMVATVDGKADRTQLNLLAKHIFEIFQLSLAEHARLRGLAGLLRGVGVDAVTTKAVVDALAPEQREAVGRLLIAVVACDGVVSLSEKKSLKATFERLGIGTAKLDECLTKLRTEDGVTIVQRARSAGRGEAIPAPPVDEPIQLNRAAIEQLLKDTREVQQVLAEAMRDEEESLADPAPEPASDAEPISTISLDTRFQPLYNRLIERDAWPLAEAAALAREKGHMIAGALETINDWALETFGSPLFYEEGDMLIVELEILNC